MGPVGVGGDDTTMDLVADQALQPLALQALSRYSKVPISVTVTAALRELPVYSFAHDPPEANSCNS